MKVLFIGGTGIISTACTKLAVARGFDVTLLNRSLRGGVPGARTVTADVSDPGAADRALAGGTWDALQAGDGCHRSAPLFRSYYRGTL